MTVVIVGGMTHPLPRRPDPDPAEQLTFSAAARRIPELSIDGRPVTVSTLSRWSHRGRRSRSGRRVHLRTWLIGGRPVTSAAAVRAFLAALDDRPAAPSDDATTDAELDAALA